MATQPIANFLVRFDQIADRIPGLSTGTNLLDIFFRVIYEVVSCFTDRLSRNYFYEHLRHKSLSDCLILMVPGLGNFKIWKRDQERKKEIFDQIDQGDSIYYVEHRLSNDASYIEELVKKDPDLFKLASRRVRDLDCVVRTAVEGDGMNFSYASERIRKNSPDLKKLYVLAAVAEGATLDRYPDYNNDEDVVKAAIGKRGLNYRYASEAIRARKDILLSFVDENPAMVLDTSLELQDDDEIAEIVLSKHGNFLKDFSPRIRSNRKYVEMAIETYPKAFILAPEPMRGDRELALKALRLERFSSHGIFKAMSPELQKDPELIKLAMKTSHSVFIDIDQEFKQDPQFIEELMREGLLNFEYGKHYITTVEQVKLVISQNASQFFHSEAWLENPDIVHFALGPIFARAEKEKKEEKDEGARWAHRLANTLQYFIEKTDLLTKKDLLISIVTSYPQFLPSLNPKGQSDILSVLEKLDRKVLPPLLEKNEIALGHFMKKDPLILRDLSAEFQERFMNP